VLICWCVDLLMCWCDVLICRQLCWCQNWRGEGLGWGKDTNSTEKTQEKKTNVFWRVRTRRQTCVDVSMTVLMIVSMCWCVDVLMCCVDVLMCWCVDVLMCWCVDVLMCCVDVLRRCVDVLMTVLMCWCVDLLMCWFADVRIGEVRVMCWCDVLICWWSCYCVDDCVDVLSWRVDVLMLLMLLIRRKNTSFFETAVFLPSVGKPLGALSNPHLSNSSINTAIHQHTNTPTHISTEQHINTVWKFPWLFWFSGLKSE
jgi:hypothetical protein